MCGYGNYFDDKKMFERRYKISIIFNANKVYDRGVICGIGEYLQASQCDWDVYIEEDFYSSKRNTDVGMCDGIIADFDDPYVEESLKNSNAFVVGVGGSYQKKADYPNVSYVATDNFQLVDSAFKHLRSKGLENFAFYGMPENRKFRWASERELAFKKLMEFNGLNGSVYHGYETNPDNWSYTLNRLADWLQQFSDPTGIIAVTDARARHLLQVCDHLGIMVPDKIAVIGIDNEELTQYLSRVSLSSVEQGTKRMGYEAAKMLHQQLSGKNNNLQRILIPPVKVHGRQSSDYKPLKDPNVIHAMHYIRLNACKGIKVEQVLDHVGISRSNLEGRFRSERGHSIHQEIHNIKLDKAKDLLIGTSLSIQEISDVCGYPSLQYMYAVFKKECDMTPKDYRYKK
jgi:LacI family transcriptional regulator